MKNIIIGTQVTCKNPIEAYYSNYGGNERCFFTSDDMGIVGEIKVPYVNKTGTFTCVDFEKDGKNWRVALDNKNIVIK